MQTDRSGRVGVHEYSRPVGKHEVIAVEPAVGTHLYIELIPGRLNVSGIVSVEELVAPSVSVDTETRKLAPGGDGIEIERQCGSSLRGHEYRTKQRNKHNDILSFHRTSQSELQNYKKIRREGKTLTNSDSF